MDSNDLKKALVSLECCNGKYEDSSCDNCPYEDLNDEHWSCIDKRCEDLIKILDWSIETMETLEHFLNRK